MRYSLDECVDRLTRIRKGFEKHTESLNESILKESISSQDFTSKLLMHENINANKERWEELIKRNFEGHVEYKFDMFDNVVNVFLYDADETVVDDTLASDIAESIYYYILNSNVDIKDNWLIRHDGVLEMGFEIEEDTDEIIPMVKLTEELNEDATKEDSMRKVIYSAVSSVKNEGANYLSMRDVTFSDNPHPEEFDYEFDLRIGDDTYEIKREHMDSIKSKLERHPLFKNYEITFSPFRSEGAMNVLHFIPKEEQITEEDVEEEEDAVSTVNTKSSSVYLELVDRIKELAPKIGRMDSFKFNSIISGYLVQNGFLKKNSQDYDVIKDALQKAEDKKETIDRLAKDIISFYKDNEKFFTEGIFKQASKVLKESSEKKLLKEAEILVDIHDVIPHVSKELAKKSTSDIHRLLGQFLYNRGYINEYTTSHIDLEEGLKKALKDYSDEYGLVRDVRDFYDDITTEKLAEDSELTDKQSDKLEKKREEIVKDLKDEKESFKDNYGDDWQSVMYATATKMAKKELGLTEAYINASKPKTRYIGLVESNGESERVGVSARSRKQAREKIQEYCEKNSKTLKNIKRKIN